MTWSVSRIVLGVVSVALVGGGAVYVATQVVGDEEPTQKAREAFEQDSALPAFRGQLGDFFVGGAGSMERPCPPPYEPIHDLSVIQESELYSEVFGDEPQAGTCADGSIVGVVQWGEAMLSRAYFLGDPQFPSEVPEERLELLSVAGRPAIAELPIANALVSDAQVVVIERFPEDDRPGIMVSVRTVSDLEGAISLAERILETTQ